VLSLVDICHKRGHRISVALSFAADYKEDPILAHPQAIQGDYFALIHRRPAGEQPKRLTVLPSNETRKFGRVMNSPSRNDGGRAPLLDQISSSPRPVALDKRQHLGI
jgi:hypothetical protein